MALFFDAAGAWVAAPFFISGAQVLALNPLNLEENDGTELQADVFGDALAPPDSLAFAVFVPAGGVNTLVVETDAFGRCLLRRRT